MNIDYRMIVLKILPSHSEKLVSFKIVAQNCSRDINLENPTRVGKFIVYPLVASYPQIVITMGDNEVFNCIGGGIYIDDLSEQLELQEKNRNTIKFFMQGSARGAYAETLYIPKLVSNTLFRGLCIASQNNFHPTVSFCVEKQDANYLVF